MNLYVRAIAHRVYLHRAEHDLGVVSGRLSARGPVVVPEGQLVHRRGLFVKGASLAPQVLPGAAQPDVLGLDLGSLGKGHVPVRARAGGGGLPGGAVRGGGHTYCHCMYDDRPLVLFRVRTKQGQF